MIFTPVILAALTVALATHSIANPIHKRETVYREEGLFVGGTVVGKGYIEKVDDEEACVKICNDLEKCNAVNYFPDHKACLPQEEAFQGEDKERLASAKVDNTVYIIVKDSGRTRRKRQMLPPVPRCRLDDVLVGGTVVNNSYIEKRIESEEQCIEECAKLDDCNAVNYWPEFGDCLPQIETLADPEHRDGLASREEPGTVYIVVNGCNEDIKRPDNILPPVQPEQSGEESDENDDSSKGSDDAPTQRFRPLFGNFPFGRKKRDANCKLEDVLVGGTVVNVGGNQTYIDDIESEEACVEECNKLESCKAVNYFPKHQACLPQEESLADPEHGLASREEPGTTYIVVKGCSGGIERPADILPPAKPEQSGEESDESNDSNQDSADAPTKRFRPLFGNFPFGRKKRDANCKLEDVLVGGTVVHQTYIKDIESEEACVEECKKLESCKAVNYFPKHQACLPQEESLADPEHGLTSREEPGTTYIVVKGCSGGIERPADILPPAEPEQSGEKTDENDDSSKGSDDDSSEKSGEGNENEGDNTNESSDDDDDASPPQKPNREPEPDSATPSHTRRKRDVNCKLENVLVGGSLVNNAVIDGIESEEACIEECNKLESCNAINYFPKGQDCWPQEETLANPDEKDRLSSREEPGTTYIVVKGCTADIERPANILPPASHESEESQEESKEDSEETSNEDSQNQSNEESQESSGSDDDSNDASPPQKPNQQDFTAAAKGTNHPTNGRRKRQV